MTLTKSTVTVLILAALLFVPLFATQGIGRLDFWWWITGNIVLLLAVVQIVDTQYRRRLVDDVRSSPVRKVLLGLLSAAALYMVFWVGNHLMRALFARAGGDIEAV